MSAGGVVCDERRKWPERWPAARYLEFLASPWPEVRNGFVRVDGMEAEEVLYSIEWLAKRLREDYGIGHGREMR